MAAGETGCDGCGRTVSSTTSTTIVLPNGNRVTCCPDCEPHARAAANGDATSSLDQRRGACDGCRGTYLETDLEELVLDDGTVLTCCPSCAAQAPGRRGADGSDESDGTNAGNGATASESDSTSTGAASTDAEDATADRDGGAAVESIGNRCSQCGETVAAELFRVTTIDGRAERFCEGCKDGAEEDGIVKNVEMRATRAREVLGVDVDASRSEIRSAYHTQVKRAHPDRKSGSRSAFQLVTDAYERLQRDAVERTDAADTN